MKTITKTTYSENQTSTESNVEYWFHPCGALWWNQTCPPLLHTVTFIFFLMALAGTLSSSSLSAWARLHTPCTSSSSQLPHGPHVHICDCAQDAPGPGDRRSYNLSFRLWDPDVLLSDPRWALNFFSCLPWPSADMLLCADLSIILADEPEGLWIPGVWMLVPRNGGWCVAHTHHYELPLLSFQKNPEFLLWGSGLMKLSCSDISLYKMVMYLCCVLMLLIPTVVISSSYALILHLIHRMSSSESRRKAFATCSSHMTVVLLFFGAAIYTYMLPSFYHTAEQDMMVSAFYTIITPVLNPLIYSLRNKDVTGALRQDAVRAEPKKSCKKTMKMTIYFSLVILFLPSLFLLSFVTCFQSCKHWAQ